MSVYCQKIQISFDVHFYKILSLLIWAQTTRTAEDYNRSTVTEELIDAIVKADDIWLQLIVSREGPEVTFFI